MQGHELDQLRVHRMRKSENARIKKCNTDNWIHSHLINKHFGEGHETGDLVVTISEDIAKSLGN